MRNRQRGGLVIGAWVVALVLIGASCSASTTTADGVPPPPAMAFSDALEERTDGQPALTVVAPASGATVTSPVGINVLVERFELAPKGVVREGEGHLHVMIDEPCVRPGEVISDDYVHLGDGQAEFELPLSLGRHELCVQLGDGFHTAMAVTKEITVTVVG